MSTNTDSEETDQLTLLKDINVYLGEVLETNVNLVTTNRRLSWIIKIILVIVAFNFCIGLLSFTVIYGNQAKVYSHTMKKVTEDRNFMEFLCRRAAQQGADQVIEQEQRQN